MDLAKNYDRVLLVAGGVLALVGGGYWAMQASSFKSTFEREIPTPGAKLDALPLDGLNLALESVAKAPTPWQPPTVGEHKTIGLMVSSPFVVRKDDQDTPLDMLASDASQVRPPIDNWWWVKNNIDYTSVNAVDEDPDGDGFSNLDEFKEKTDPRSQLSRPQPITKLYFTGRTADPLTLKLNGFDASSNTANIKWEGTADSSGRTSKTEFVKIGASFYNSRFVVESRSQTEVEKAGTKSVVDVVLVKDTLNADGSPLKLVQSQVVDRPTYKANFHFGLTGKDYVAKQDEDFDLEGQSLTIEVKEIGAEHSSISFTPAGSPTPVNKRLEKTAAPSKK